MKNHTPFGRELKKLRVDFDESIRDMASKLGITASYLSAIETGKRNVPLTMVAELKNKYSLSEKQKCVLLMSVYGLTCPICGSKIVENEK